MKKHVNELEVGDVFRFDGDEYMAVSYKELTDDMLYLNITESKILPAYKVEMFCVVEVVDLSKRGVTNI